jgi:hypothetical protein
MITNHVVNLELSKRLHELGIAKCSIFYWGLGGDIYPDRAIVLPFSEEEILTYDKRYAAYTASELLEILPPEIEIDKINRFFIEITRRIIDNNFIVEYTDVDLSCHFEVEKNICNALAKMAIYLVESGLMEVKDESHK